MKKYLKTMIIGLIFIIIADFIIGKSLEHFYFNTTSGVLCKTTYSIDSTKSDILIFGTSRANHHYNVKILEDSTGLTAYNTGRDGSFIFYHTAILKSILKRYTPKQIILDFNGTFEYMQDEYDQISALLPYMRTHKELKSIIALKSPWEKLKLISNIYPYNSQIITIIMGNLEINKNRSKNKYTYNGYVPLYGTWEYEFDSAQEAKKKYTIDEKKYKVFTEFINLCNQNNIPLIVVFSPVFYNNDNNYSLEICDELCKNNNIPFIDFSNDRDFINKELFYDPFHLNNEGATLLTQKVLRLIRNEE
jgi:hypothetical protein